MRPSVPVPVPVTEPVAGPEPAGAEPGPVTHAPEGWLRLNKWDGSTSKSIPWHSLGADGFGCWYRWPAGAVMTRRAGPPVRHTSDRVLLVPTEGSWIARWGGAGSLELYCDVTTPPEPEHEGSVRAIDLDLDVVRYRTGRVAVIDQAQFDQRRVTMGYPNTVVQQALATARWLYRAVSGGLEPFASVGAAVLAGQPTPAPASHDLADP